MEPPWWLSGKESTCQCRHHGFNLWVETVPWRRKLATIPVLLPGKSPWTEESGRLQSMGSQKNQIQLSNYTTSIYI